MAEIHPLNAICPYFTMFPLSFPMGVLAPRAEPHDSVMDPFAGRGTTLMAARILGLSAIGIDSSPVAIAICQAKLVSPSPRVISRTARTILDEIVSPRHVPVGRFWRTAYHPMVLHTLCRLREGLLRDCRSPARIALRAIILGALHGPLNKVAPSYFSNQSFRSFAPKPRYAVKYWERCGLTPPNVDLLAIIDARSARYYSNPLPSRGLAILGDSRTARPFRRAKIPRVKWIITSPPYYGMRTYIPDQWLRIWFLGGPATVDYSSEAQLQHSSPDQFAHDLRQVWDLVATVADSSARLVIRFGGISDRAASPTAIMRHSLQGTPWRLDTICSAGSSSSGRRQAMHILSAPRPPTEEFDYWASLRAEH